MSLDLLHSGTYYQLWSGGVGTLNTGSNGLQVFDTVVAQAKAYVNISARAKSFLPL